MGRTFYSFSFEHPYIGSERLDKLFPEKCSFLKCYVEPSPIHEGKYVLRGLIRTKRMTVGKLRAKVFNFVEVEGLEGTEGFHACLENVGKHAEGWVLHILGSFPQPGRRTDLLQQKFVKDVQTLHSMAGPNNPLMEKAIERLKSKHAKLATLAPEFVNTTIQQIFGESKKVTDSPQQPTDTRIYVPMYIGPHDTDTPHTRPTNLQKINILKRKRNPKPNVARSDEDGYDPSSDLSASESESENELEPEIDNKNDRMSILSSCDRCQIFILVCVFIDPPKRLKRDTTKPLGNVPTTSTNEVIIEMMNARVYNPNLSLTESEKKTIKENAWRHWFGNDHNDTKCPVCCGTLQHTTFQGGHILAQINGGDYSKWNILPQCANCNQRQQQKDVFVFITGWSSDQVKTVAIKQWLWETSAVRARLVAKHGTRTLQEWVKEVYGTTDAHVLDCLELTNEHARSIYKNLKSQSCFSRHANSGDKKKEDGRRDYELYLKSVEPSLVAEGAPLTSCCKPRRFSFPKNWSGMPWRFLSLGRRRVFELLDQNFVLDKY